MGKRDVINGAMFERGEIITAMCERCYINSDG